MPQPRKHACASGLLVLAGLLPMGGCAREAPAVPITPEASEAKPPEAPAAPLTPRISRAKPLTGGELYLTHCAGCHGDKGDGNGLAARFLYPRPRDFSEAQFRLVSTKNNIPTDADLEMVLRQGMPGSAMMPFRHLPEAEIKALVVEVRRLIRTGSEQRLRKQLAASGEELTDDDLAKTVEGTTRPGEPFPLPKELPPATKESIARGKALYLDTKLGCVSCHGETGKGDGVQDQKNNDGMPTRPRDFTRGIFKGGRDVKQMYLRVRRGMPGSPMPSADFLNDQQVGDLVNFILSLSPPEATEKVSHRRRELLARRVEQLPKEIPATAWASAHAVPIVVTPLWWRDQPDPELRVQALHDGQTLAVRLTWRDEIANNRVIRPDDFEDMAAVQLFQGQPEPFLGMGGTNQGIDLWLWRATWQGKGREPESPLDDYPFDTPQYKRLTKGKGSGLPDLMTARAAGNFNARPDGKASASGLTARGPGSVTLVPIPSQQVSAKAEWKKGEWSVTLRRPLAVKAGEGVPLAAKEHCSIAFALWFGEARDRNGQKLVSIWHDMKLE